MALPGSPFGAAEGTELWPRTLVGRWVSGWDGQDPRRRETLGWEATVTSHPTVPSWTLVKKIFLLRVPIKIIFTFIETFHVSTLYNYSFVNCHDILLRLVNISPVPILQSSKQGQGRGWLTGQPGGASRPESPKTNQRREKEEALKPLETPPTRQIYSC